MPNTDTTDRFDLEEYISLGAVVQEIGPEERYEEDRSEYIEDLVVSKAWAKAVLEDNEQDFTDRDVARAASAISLLIGMGEAV